MMKSLKAGFTLAEVLVTLMVIGVVAAMTIPTLMASTNNQQDVVATKKAASVLSGAVQLLTAQDTACEKSTSKDAAENSQKLATCMTKVLSGNVSQSNGVAHVLNTTDGMQMAFYANGDAAWTGITSCGSTLSTTANDFHGANSCAVIVDVNGSKKGTSNHTFPTVDTFTKDAGFATNPQSGTDIVAFSMSAYSVRPLVYNDTTDYNNPTYAAIYGVDANTIDTSTIYDQQVTCYKTVGSGVSACYCKKEYTAGTSCSSNTDGYTGTSASGSACASCS